MASTTTLNEAGRTYDGTEYVRLATPGANWKIQMSTIIREKLAANRTYYVRTDGSDSNDGLANTAGGAFLTIQHAIDTVASLDVNGFDATIQLQAGTWNENLILYDYVGDTASLNVWLSVGGPTIVGDTGTPSNVTLASTDGAHHIVDGRLLTKPWTIDGVTLADVPLAAFTAVFGPLSGPAHVYFGNVKFGAYTAGYHRSGQTRMLQNYTISGSCLNHTLAFGSVFAEEHANYVATTITLSGSPVFSGGYVAADIGSSIEAYGLTFSGSTGSTSLRYVATLNSTIQTYGGGANFFPGDTPGTTDASSVYG